MTATFAGGEVDVARLYARYKALTIGTTAALMLDRPVTELGAEAELLLEQSRLGGSAFEGCVTAAADLCELLRLAALGSSTSAQLEQVRASHLRLRREVWAAQPCEYVPCCVSESHHH